MKYKYILLTIFLILIFCLTIQSISAENVTNDSYDDEIGSCPDEIDVELDDSKDVLSDSEEDILSEISSDPLPTVETGVVSGGVDFTNTHPWAPSDAVNGNRGNITYKIPSTAKDIKSAYVYVNVYSGSGGTAYGAYANTTIRTANVEKQLGSEFLWTATSSQNGVKYIVNDHIDRVYSDYMIFYNVTDLLQGLNGTSVSVDVLSYPMEGKSFDGRIKLISLFVAWDDGDSDEIYYWLNAGQAWTDDTQNGISHTFENIPDFDFNEKLSTIINVGVSSTDALYLINGLPFFSESPSDEYINGAYYQYHKWDISNYIESGTMEVGYKAVGGAYTPSFKNIISILTIQDIPTYEEDVAQISLTPEFTEIPSAYAGTNNTLTIKITTKEGKYTVKLLADGKVINQTQSNLNDGLNTVFLTDPTIRAVDEFTVNGAENKKVNYTVEVSSNGKLINSSSIVLPILYNGNLGKDLAYPSGGIDSFLNITVTGDIVIDIQSYKNYISANIPNRTEVWHIDLDENSSFVKSFIYLPYYEFNSKTYVEDENMFNVTFNDVNIVPIELYRDQSNLGRSYYSGYGVFVYDVTGLIRKGENYLNLTKKFDTPAVYPSALIYMYNTTGSNSIKEIYIHNGADLLEAISNNVAKRTVHTDTKIDVNSNLTSNATLYVFASGPQPDEGNLMFNGEFYENIWNANSTSYEAYSLDITNSVRDSNYISFISTGYRIIALQQIIVLSKNLDDLDISMESEYPDTCYAGTNNYITVKIEAVKDNRVMVRLMADGEIVNETEIDLVYGHNEFILIDPTIRAVDEFTVIGADNKKVNYTVQLLSNGKIIDSSYANFTILYDGYLSKDLAYPTGGIVPFLNITINGDIVVDIKDDSSYLGDFDIKRTDVWNVDLDNGSTIVKALVYVPYNSFNVNLIPSEDGNMFNVKFNGNSISPIGLYRDQSNLGRNGMYGHGLLVYDVTDLIGNGKNSFELNKIQPTPRVYPSALIYMYNNTNSSLIKNVYISNGADLLSKDSNRAVQVDSTINTDSLVDVAKLYVFAANAQSGEGDIIFNGEAHENVWKGTASSTDLYILDISDTIRNSNGISFLVRDDTLLALQQMIVTTHKTQSKIIASNLTMLYNGNGSLVAGLSDVNGKVISNAKINIVLDGNLTVLTTNSSGQVSLTISSTLLPNTYDVNLSFTGDDNYMASSANIKLVIEKVPTQIIASNLTMSYNSNASLIIGLSDVNGKAISNGELSVVLNGNLTVLTTNTDGQVTLPIPSSLLPKTYEVFISYQSNETHNESYKTVTLVIEKISTKITVPKATTVYNTNKNVVITLKDAKGKAVAKANVKVVLNGKSKDLTTNSKGQATYAIPSNLVPKTYTLKVSYAGDNIYVKSSASNKVVVKKASVKLAAKKKTFKAKVKTKKYTVTLKNNKGKAMNKVKLTLKIKNKKFTAITNAKGQATFKITKLTKKGNYNAKVIYNGSKYFNKLTKKVKISIKK